MCPDWELNPQPFGYRMMLQPTEPHQPGAGHMIFKCAQSIHIPKKAVCPKGMYVWADSTRGHVLVGMNGPSRRAKLRHSVRITSLAWQKQPVRGSEEQKLRTDGKGLGNETEGSEELFKVLGLGQLEFPRDPAIPLPHMPTRENAGVHTKTCTQMFTATVFTTAKKLLPPKHPATDKCIGKMRSVHGMEY